MWNKLKIILIILIIAVSVSPFLSAADRIVFSSPMMLDSAINRSIVQSFGPRGFVDSGLVAASNNYNLILYSANVPSELWLMMRTDSQGNLIDTIPVPLVADAALPIKQSFLCRHVIWKDPYFYVFGFIKIWGSSAPDEPGYIRVSENLTVIDSEPIILNWSITGADDLKFLSDIDKLWLLYRIYPGTWKAALYDFNGDSLLFRDVAIADASVETMVMTVSDGLFVEWRRGGTDNDTLFNNYVSHQGVVSWLDTLVVTGLGKSTFTSISALSYGTDSVLVCFLDKSSGGTYRFRYYFLSPAAPTLAATLKEISYWFYPARWTNYGALFAVNNGQVISVSTSQYLDESKMAFYRFDPINRVLVNSGQLPGTSIPEAGAFFGDIIVDNRMLYYYRFQGGINVLNLDLSDPLNTVATTPILHGAEYQQSPSLTTEGNNLLLFMEMIDSAGPALKGFRISTTPEIGLTGSFPVLDENYKPYAPVIRAFDSKKVLLWKEDVSANYAGQLPFSVFQERSVVFEGDYPLASELAKQDSILPVIYHYPPTFIQIDSLIYMDIYSNNIKDYWDNDAGHQLRCIDLSTGQLTSFYIYFTSNGTTALIRQGDSLLSIRSWKKCSSSGSACYAWDGGYDAYVIRPTNNYLSAVLREDHNLSYGGVPTDLTAASFENGELYALANSYELVRISKLMTFSQVTDLGAFNGYSESPSSIIPIQTTTANAVIMLSQDPVNDGDNNFLHNRLLVYDRNWKFIDSVNFPLPGIPIQFSEFVPVGNRIIFAYAAYVAGDYTAPRVFLQSVELDINTGVDEELSRLPKRFSVSQNYPNPFNMSTGISFELPRSANIKGEIYNVLGQRVATLIDKFLPAGKYNLSWNGLNSRGGEVGSGIYFYRFRAGDWSATKKMILLK